MNREKRDRSESSLVDDVILELPVGGFEEYPELIDAIKEQHPKVEMLYRAGLKEPELYLGTCDQFFRGLEMLRHMYLKRRRP